MPLSSPLGALFALGLYSVECWCQVRSCAGGEHVSDGRGVGDRVCWPVNSRELSLRRRPEQGLPRWLGYLACRSRDVAPCLVRDVYVGQGLEVPVEWWGFSAVLGPQGFCCSVYSVGLVTLLTGLLAGVFLVESWSATSSELFPVWVLGLHLSRGTGVASLSAWHLELSFA